MRWRLAKNAQQDTRRFRSPKFHAIGAEWQMAMKDSRVYLRTASEGLTVCKIW